MRAGLTILDGLEQFEQAILSINDSGCIRTFSVCYLTKIAKKFSIALQPDLAEGHFVRGFLLWTHGNRFPHEQAIQSDKRAITLDPNLAPAHHHLGVMYFHIGLLDKAEEHLKQALAINPSDTLARFRLGSINVCRGEYEEALTVLKTVPREANAAIVDRATADALLHLGRIEEASEIVENYLTKNSTDEGGNVTSVKAILLAEAGKQREAVEMVQRAIEIGKGFQHFHHTTYNIAAAYALLNKPDEALKWLQDIQRQREYGSASVAFGGWRITVRGSHTASGLSSVRLTIGQFLNSVRDAHGTGVEQ